MSPSVPRNLALGTFGELLIVFSTKVNLPYLLYSMARRCCLLNLIRQNCLLKTFLITLILMTQVSPYLFSLLELHAFFISNTFISNARLKLAKHQAKAKQHPEAELLIFENYSLLSSTLSSKNNR